MTFPATQAPSPGANAFDLFESVFETVERRLDAAIAFAGSTGTDVRFLSRKNLLRLWRAGHSHALGNTDGAETTLTPATELLAVASRSKDGAAVICVPRRILDVDALTLAWHAAQAVVRLAANLSARAEIAGEMTGRLQIVALDDADGPLLVEQFPRPRLLLTA